MVLSVWRASHKRCARGVREPRAAGRAMEVGTERRPGGSGGVCSTVDGPTTGRSLRCGAPAEKFGWELQWLVRPDTWRRRSASGRCDGGSAAAARRRTGDRAQEPPLVVRGAPRGQAGHRASATGEGYYGRRRIWSRGRGTATAILPSRGQLGAEVPISGPALRCGGGPATGACPPTRYPETWSATGRFPCPMSGGVCWERRASPARR
jgi:hypothetical protein